jgi:hypothetical protein
MNGLSAHQLHILALLADRAEPAMPDELGTIWPTLRALKRKGLVDWQRLRDSSGIEGAVITPAGRSRLSRLTEVSAR